MEKKPYKIDIPVLIIFFVRDDVLKKVFDEVKKARPSRLYLYQDGPREGCDTDLIGLKNCREIVSNIDWECEVKTFYQEKNVGCDPSEYIAQKWMFETEEMGIVLEDDDVPSQSFFPYCKELLEKYKDDKRINFICGMNNIEIARHISASYLYTKKGSICGWGSWKRVLDCWDPDYKWLEDKDCLDKIRKQITTKQYKTFINISKKHRDSGRAHYESINAAAMFLNEAYNIVPKYNQISNIGISNITTHGVNDLRLLSKRGQKLLYMKTYEIEFPLIHPTDFKRDYKFERKMTPNAIQTFFAKVEHLFRVWKYKGFGAFIEKIKRKLKRKKK